MKRTLTLALMLGLLAGAMSTVQATPHHDWRTRAMRYGTLDGNRRFSPPEVRLTIRSALKRWPIPGGLAMAFCIAERESGFNPRAANPSSSARGVFQVVKGTWDSFYRSVPDIVRWHHIGYDRLNARNNVLVVIRKMSQEGLGPWGGGCG